MDGSSPSTSSPHQQFVPGHGHSASMSGGVGGRKRVYAKDQSSAYSGGGAPGYGMGPGGGGGGPGDFTSPMGGSGGAPGAPPGYPGYPGGGGPPGPPASAGPYQSSFSQAGGPPPPGPPGPGGQYFSPDPNQSGGGQQPPMTPTTGQGWTPGHGGGRGQSYSAGMGGLTGQFGNMNMGKGNLPFQSTNLINSGPLPVEELEAPPPEAKLPPGASISTAPTVNCDPSYKRCTLNAIPTNESLLKKSKLPLALIISPHRSQGSDPEVPIISDTVIARCRRCRTYINPYVTFFDSGTRWKCCMCNLSNEVPQMFDWDQELNQPADRWQRKELNHSVVEFIAPTEYMVRPPQPPTYVFCIDISYNAVSTGMVATAARTILESLDRLPNVDSRTRIAIIGVDSCLHFFSLTPGSTEANMLVVGDLDDVFLPKPTDLLVNLTECREGLESLLGKFGDMFKENHSMGNAMGAALQVAHKMISITGGKISVLTAGLPNMGPGVLKPREDAKILGTPKESTLLQPQTSFYKELAIETSRSQVSVDMWLFGSSYTDLATLSCLPRYTGGQTYFYPAFNAGRQEDALKFAHEFGEVLGTAIGLEAVMRVRASRGLRMSAFHGNFFVRSTDLLALPAVPHDQSYAIEVQIEDPLTVPFVVFQTAVLHTSSFGERRIRVVTLALPTTSSLSELYASADQVALTTLLANKAVERSMGSKLEDARDAIVNKLVEILGVYKTTMTAAGGGASPHLVIPDNLKFLPLLMLGLLKHVGVRQSAHIPSDLRAYAQALLTTLPAQLLIPYLHPSFYSLHNMPPECGTIDENGVIMPPAMNLTSERFERHGLFLIEDGQNMFLWVGRDAVPQLVMDVFGCESYQALRGGKTTLTPLKNPFSERVNAIIGKVREMRRGPYWPHLYVVKEDGDASLRLWALSCLIEDRTEQLPSYHQFLTQLKDKVNGGGY